MSALFDGMGGEPLRETRSINERGVERREVTWLLAREDWRPPQAWRNLERVSATTEPENGAWRHVAVYEGLAGEGGGGGQREPALVTYELDGTQSQQPIQSHPDFERLRRVYGWEKLEDGSFGFPKQVPAGGGGGAREGGISPLYGVTAWMDVGVVWRKTWAVREAEVPRIRLQDLGRISVPEGPAPRPGERRNWMLSGVRMRQRGNSVEVTKEWMLSGRGGWDLEIYRRV